MSNRTVTTTTLSPPELERVSGLSTGMQRVWRQRGFLPAVERGHARFDLLTSASIMVRQALSVRGFPPSKSEYHGAIAAPWVLWCALNEDAACEVVGEATAVDEFEHAFFKDGDLVAELAGVSNDDVNRFLLAFDSEQPELDDNLGEVIENSGAASGYFVNLQVLGERLVAGLGRPLLRIELGDPPTSSRQKHVRRALRTRRSRG